MMTSCKRKILLVDDSEVVLMTERLLLRQLGNFELLSAKNGEEGVRVAQAEVPDLILMDVVMPKMGGFDACRAIRADQRTRAIPIIMVSTRGEAENLSKGYEAGCTDYVTKPIDKNELAAKLKELLD